MDNIALLLLTGFVVGTLGTLIGAGGGFILVPILIITHPEFSTETITAISMAIVASNAVSGTIAYARSGRIDYKAGLIFALFTIPGSIFGVFTTSYIPAKTFHVIFGLLLIFVAFFLFLSKKTLSPVSPAAGQLKPGYIDSRITDRYGEVHQYRYRMLYGILISLVVGYLSPLLGIGGGIIHVPALIHWLNFPVYIATATSHFILAIMSVVSVITHAFNGSYRNPEVLRMVLALGFGAIAGAQLGALLSHRIKGNLIVRALAVCLALVGIRILLSHG
ncbi:MAG TPA: sulfite exporter TauE/SafE family protein [Puia sp.]|nr:sulfite exporter TauE/SafE family protein [Puia sp.]